jgi:hypothetical protein
MAHFTFDVEQLVERNGAGGILEQCRIVHSRFRAQLRSITVEASSLKEAWD